MTESNPKSSSTQLKPIVAVVLIIIAFVIGQLTQSSGFSVSALLGIDTDKSAQTENVQQDTAASSQSAEWAKTADAAVPENPQLDLDYVQILVDNMNESERTQVLSDPALFKQAIENEKINRSVLSAALANKLEQDANVGFLMQRGADNILREAYLKRLIANQLPADFPNAEQLQEYYQNNQSQFVLPERLHVWQIFYRKPVDADEKSIKAIKEKANKAYDKLNKGKAVFAELAVAESEHEQSQANGGYMGLLKTSELIAAIKEPLLAMKEGQLSKPIESETGFHILKRGEIIEAEALDLSQVEPQIRQLLMQQAVAQFRKAIFIQASKEYPQNLTDEKIEEWRLRLKTDTVKN